MSCKKIGNAIICGPSKEYKVGDPRPETDSYFDINEWAETQIRGGLKETQCPSCNRWKFPQEMSKIIKKEFAVSKTMKSPIYRIKLNICKKCANGE